VAKIKIDLDFPLFPVEKNIFGHFTEHAFQNIYGGMYDPESPLADEDGFRTDVLELLKRVNVPILRYPGGNFVSNYHWEDGVGPKASRKRVFEYAWLTEESNQFGTVEFIKLCRKVGAEPLICVNMGSGTPEEAMHWVEYCNGTGDTYYANLRRSHGYEEPFGVKYWGLGNEMYGSWQMENLSAEEYARRAFHFAKCIKWVDPTVKLIACGLQSDADWNRAVMKEVGTMCDYISAHHYSIGWGPFEAGNYLKNLYIPEYLELLNTLTVSAINAGMNDVTGHCKVAWDEWNLFGWVVDGVDDDRSYTLHNTIITALILNRFLRNSDTIGMANYSTFVNINGALSTHDDRVVRRAQYAAFELLANYTGDEVLEAKLASPTMTIPVSGGSGRPAKGLLNSLGVEMTSPGAAKPKFIDVPTLDCLATRASDGTIYLSIINKSPDQTIDASIELAGLGSGKTAAMKTIWHEDLDAANTLDAPDTIAIRDGDAPQICGDTVTAQFKPHSVNMIIIS